MAKLSLNRGPNSDFTDLGLAFNPVVFNILAAAWRKSKICMKILERKLTLQMHFIQKFEV
jgi:hypothetical protein